MTSPTSPFTIGPLTVPRALDSPDAADFLAFADLNRRICELDAGRAELALSAAEALPGWQDDTDRLSLGLVARQEVEILGMATLVLAQEAGARVGEIDIMVLPEHWGVGVEDALLLRAEEEARLHGRTSIQTWTLHRAEPPLHTPTPADATGSTAHVALRFLTPRTGWGRVRATPLAALLQRHGYAIEQVERNSAFDLRADPAPVAAMLRLAIASAGPDYRQIAWTLPTPPALRDGYAAILARDGDRRPERRAGDR